MSFGNPAHEKIVKALLARQRGRPKKAPMQDDDTIRAALVVWAFTENPGQFRTRREAIKYLQALSQVAGNVADELAKTNELPEYRLQLEQVSRRFPLRELEQSVSRGMNKHNGLLGRLEKLAKKSR